MRQRLIKAIFCIALSVSVFFCSSSFAFADEYTGHFVLTPQNYAYLVEFVTPLTPEYPNDSLSSYGIGTVYFGTRYSISLDGGYVYNGQLHRRIAISSSPNNSFTYSNMSLSEMYLPSPMQGVNLSVKLSTPATGSYLDVYINFNDVYINHDVTLQSSFTLKFTQRVAFSNSDSTSVTDANYTIIPSVATDTAGFLDQSLPSGVNVGGVISDSAQQQIQQQQQIADQQAQQSSQQHENLVNGYDNSQDKANQEAFDSVLSNHESQEHALLEEAMTNVSEVEMDLSWVDRLTATFSFIRTVFMAIVTASGDFGILISVTLCFALALFALGWFRS